MYLYTHFVIIARKRFEFFYRCIHYDILGYLGRFKKPSKPSMATVVELKPHVRAKLGKLKNIYLNCEKTATIAAMHIEDELTTRNFTKDMY